MVSPLDSCGMLCRSRGRSGLRDEEQWSSGRAVKAEFRRCCHSRAPESCWPESALGAIGFWALPQFPGLYLLHQIGTRIIAEGNPYAPCFVRDGNQECIDLHREALRLLLRAL